MQNLINSEGPMIIGPDMMMCGPSVAKTNPTSMRDKIKMDNPGKKILTPRGGQVVNTTTHTHGGSNSSKIQAQIQRHQHHDIDAYSSEQVSARGGNTTGASSIKHHESISGVSIGHPSMMGKRAVISTNLSEIDKKHLGMTMPSKKYGGATKNSAGRGSGGPNSVDLLSGPSSSVTLMKSKSIHGQKVSEVTVLANH